ncbi:hypothetical protein AVEN_41827-1 [Araneus ventricosus]|uniref:Uncharacterized protein n=1 Tax=Araneus ventricosus TaxID=182803 RepID=A0A4Y2ADQ6_ARAVE|nr:hypothetical protein AVEN_41827-1 [Araneus ventricosus]
MKGYRFPFLNEPPDGGSGAFHSECPNLNQEWNMDPPGFSQWEQQGKNISVTQMSGFTFSKRNGQKIKRDTPSSDKPVVSTEWSSCPIPNARWSHLLSTCCFKPYKHFREPSTCNKAHPPRPPVSWSWKLITRRKMCQT